MVIKLRLLLDYRCYPVWLYDEGDNIVDTLLPEEMRSDTELDGKFDRIQAKYDSLFKNDGIEFSYIGFSSDEDKKAFIAEWEDAMSDLRVKSGNKYIIVDDVTSRLDTL